MTQSREESPPSRIELVVLACLSQSTPPSDSELGDAVHQLALPKESAGAARQRAIELVVGLVRRSWVTSQAPRKLTESGKRALRSAFQLTRAPTWAQVRDKHLPAMAIGVAPGSELASKVCTETALQAAVLCTRFGVGDARTPTAVCDAMIANALGMPTGKLTLDRIRAHVLARGIDGQAPDAPRPDVKSYSTKLATWIAYTTVGASGQQHKMARALGRRWVCGEAHPLGVCLTSNATSKPAVPSVNPVPAPPVSPAPPAGGPIQATSMNGGTVAPGSAKEPTPPIPSDRGKASAHNLLEVVRQTIPRVGAEGRFGEKVYVSAIWRTIERDRKAGELSLDHFKHWLVRANRDGWLVLARADLIGAMDAKQVNESEINDRGATFHFVLDQRNGTSVSQRDSHAG